jgi:hypothetical protein
MNTAFILDIIPKRMKEMGFGEDYRLEHRTIRVQTGTPFILKAWNSWVWFPSEGLTNNRNLSIESNFGSLVTLNPIYVQQQHEHTGKITIQNMDGSLTYVVMIMATPFQKENKSKT